MMIEIYKTPSKEIQEVILANLTYETVIDGLNEYFASEPRNDYITVKMEIDKQDSELYAAEAWADILIEWLRKKHDIFYRPGMTLDQVEAARSAAKMCCLRAHIKDEISKISAEDIANKILDKVLETEDLLHKSVDSVNKECKAVGKQMVDDYEKDLLKFIYKEYKDRIGLSDNTITYDPPSVRNTVLKIISDYARCRTRVDILETRIKSIFDRCKANFTVDDYVLNGDPTTSFMLDCISSWIGSPAESRGKVRAEIENYKLKLKDYILNDIKKHGYRYDGLETKSIEEIVDWVIQMATCPRNEWAKDEIENLRSQITRLKGLINAMNEEVKDM